MPKLVDVSAYPIWDVINVLLEDKTTGKNVVWATDAYAARGPGYGPEDPITKSAFIGDDPVLIQPRIEKDAQEQQARTKKKAEVYTPSWLCNKMNNYCDAEWFGRPDVFNNENGGGAWTAQDDSIQFNEKKGRKTKEWQKYVDSRRLEITCGEAPFLVSRYDAATGDILPIDQRIGILDRKLRVVDENTTTESDWLKWAQRAVESCYGYEYQGDSLLIARNNVLMTFYDYYTERWKKLPEKRLFKKIANIVAWNIWQMDGLNDAPPFGKTVLKTPLPPLLQQFAEDVELESAEKVYEKPAKIKNWRSNKSLLFIELKELRFMKKKMFDFVIGNPPYQDETLGDNKDYAPPVYDKFMDSAYEVADKVELIHPARFLFNAGSTPKAWNQKMLNDQHFKVIKYWANEREVFPGQIINGGVAITYHDKQAIYKAIETFTQYLELNSIRQKTCTAKGFKSISSIVYTAYAYHFTQQLYLDHPDLLGRMSSGHEYDTKSNVFELMPEIFSDTASDKSHIALLGRRNNVRSLAYIKRKYISAPDNLDSYKVVFSAADGASGTIGKPIPARIIGTPHVSSPGQGTTESFASIGRFSDEKQAYNLLNYVKTRFARTLLGILKVTQHITPTKWKYVPLQNFTSDSDIDWTVSIPEIDQQLYKKYGLSDEEITFIETHVKEMN